MVWNKTVYFILNIHFTVLKLDIPKIFSFLIEDRIEINNFAVIVIKNIWLKNLEELWRERGQADMP